MVIGELVVVEAEEAQEGDVEVADVGLIFDCGHAEFVGGTDGVTGVAAAAGEPEAEGIGVVVAAGDLAVDAAWLWLRARISPRNELT